MGSPRRRNVPSTCSRRRGFTLLELVIVVALLAILAGSAVPVASMIFNSKATRSTREVLDDLSVACAEYFRDTFALPASPLDLHVNPGVAGWSGPYMLTAASDPITGISDSAVDAWARPFQLTAVGTSGLLIESAGVEGAFGDDTDIEVLLDVTPIRREVTLDELETINQAITLYNGVYLPDTPLSTSYDQILSRLVVTGFLPAGNDLSTDGWGDAYVPVPAGVVPVVEVGSIHLSAGGG
ncbi:MAG: prepilin-type N-terminal cleavage/methylation domain-containing protein [Planctomycetota bacterium]